MSDVDLTLLTSLAQESLEQGREIRRELRDLRTLTLNTVDYVRRLDRRMGELRDDLELMLKSELMGRFTHLQTRLDERLGSFEDQITAMEAKTRR